MIFYHYLDNQEDDFPWWIKLISSTILITIILVSLVGLGGIVRLLYEVFKIGWNII